MQIFNGHYRVLTDNNFSLKSTSTLIGATDHELSSHAHEPLNNKPIFYPSHVETIYSPLPLHFVFFGSEMIPSE